jgi:hypothetical protein
MWVGYTAVEDMKVSYALGRGAALVPIITMITILCINNDWLIETHGTEAMEGWGPYLMWTTVGMCGF